VQAELKSVQADEARLSGVLRERREREAARGSKGLMGEVARRKEAELHAARARTAAARANLLAQASALRTEVRDLEAAAEAAMHTTVRGGATTPRRSASVGPGTSATPGGLAEGEAGGAVRGPVALDSGLRTSTSNFVYRRPPPSPGAPMLLARWRRLQLGEPFELDGPTSPPARAGAAVRAVHPSSTAGADTGNRAAGVAVTAEDEEPMTRRRVWVRLSPNLRQLEVCAERGEEPPLLTWPLVETTHLSMPAARHLRLHSVRGTALRLVCADGAQLTFWWLGVVDLTSAPAAERVSHGLLLWRLAAALYAEKAARDRHHAGCG